MLVALLLAGAGLWSLVLFAAFVPQLLRQLSHRPEGDWFFVISGNLIGWIVLFPCALGIFRRRPWAYILTLAVAIDMVLMFVAGVALFGVQHIHTLRLCLPLASFLTALWLALPSVRAQFWSGGRSSAGKLN